MKGNGKLTRFRLFLATLIGILVLLVWASEVGWRGPVLGLGTSALLVVGLYVEGRDRRYLWVGLSTALPAIAARWAWELTANPAFLKVTLPFTIAFLGSTTLLLLREIRRQERIDADTVVGGICLYVLFVITFMYLHGLVELAAPGSYELAGSRLPRLGTPTGEGTFTDFLYFSLVTITTLGYGDMVPVRASSRLLAASEAMFGQLFLAVFLARLVALYTTQTSTGRPGPNPSSVLAERPS